MRPGLRSNQFEIITNRQPLATRILLTYNPEVVNGQG